MSMRTPRRPSTTPAAMLSYAVRELKALGSPERAAGTKAYFKKYEPVHFFGASVPEPSLGCAHTRYSEAP